MLIKKSCAALLLCSQFLYLMLKSGFSTLCLIIRLQLNMKKSLQDTYIAVEIANVNQTGLVVLACLLSLTPGTSVLDIDSSNNRMLLHILDAEQTDAAVREFQQKFVPYILILFAKSHQAEEN